MALLVLPATKAAHHIRDLRIPGLFHNLGGALRATAGLTADDDSGLLWYGRFDNGQEVWVRDRAAGGLIKKDHGNIDGALGVPSLEFRLGSDIQVDDRGVLAQRLVRLRWGYLCNGHKCHLPFVAAGGSDMEIPAHEVSIFVDPWQSVKRGKSARKKKEENTMEEAVYWSREGSIATVTLNRPAQFNVMNNELSSGLRKALMECWDDDEVRAVILTGNGRAFSGGGDIKFFVGALAQQNIIPSLEKMMPVLHAAIAMIREIPKPVIAALNGVAAGGGFGLALACDFRIASPQVNLVTAFLGIGASPDSSSTFFLPRHVGLAKATEMFLRNKPVPAEEALNLGLLTAVVEPDQVMAEARKLAEELAQGPTAAFGRTKLLLNQSLGNSLHEQLHSEARSITLSMGTPDFAEGITAFVEKRKARFTGK